LAIFSYNKGSQSVDTVPGRDARQSILMSLDHFRAILTWSIALLSIFCMLIRPRKIPEAWWACGGAMVLLLCRFIPLRQAARAAYEGFDVYLFLAGMMILAELAREEGVFEWVAGLAAQRAHGSPARLLLLIYCAGVIVTALLSNDATAVVLTPAVLAVVRRAQINPKPYLLACALIANAASFVLPISNPANLVVFQNSLPPLAAWLRIFLLPSLASIVVTFLCLRWISRRQLQEIIEQSEAPNKLSSSGKLAVVGLLLVALALIVCSVIGLSLGIPTISTALLLCLVCVFRDQNLLARVLRGVSWSILPLVAGLFIIVQALQNAGVLQLGLAGLQSLTRISVWGAKTLAAFAIALLANAMNNLPVGLMSGSAIRHAQESGVIAHAALLGVDLGPNLSVSGSLATILWLIALRRENVEITAWEFFKVGLLAMPLALLASLLCLRS
jgi:arsenical pump membrane protein